MNYQPLIELIKREKIFVIGSHIQPDGDSIGSLLGLGLFLKDLGKKVYLSWGEEILIPPQYSFLPQNELIQLPKKLPKKIDVFIALDCADFSRLGQLEKVARKSKILVNIDHHLENTSFGDINLIDETISSVSEAVFWLTKEMGRKLNYQIALPLYVGIVTDTGKFQYSNTTPMTFQAAGELLKYEILPEYVFRQVYENFSLSTQRLLGEILRKAQIKNGIVYSTITQKDLDFHKVSLLETENFIDMLRAIKGIKLAVLFKEFEKGKIRVSLRSKGEINVEIIAREFGGGGHREAAGFHTKLNVNETLAKIYKLVDKQLTVKREKVESEKQLG